MAITLEIVVAFGIPIAWGLWELVSLRREQARDRLKAADAAEAAKAPAALGAASARSAGSESTPPGRG